MYARCILSLVYATFKYFSQKFQTKCLCQNFYQLHNIDTKKLYTIHRNLRHEMSVPAVRKNQIKVQYDI